jgi:hypothetical protein
VVDGKEKSRELVLVDRHKHRIHTIIFCQELRFYQRLLFYSADYGRIWFARMDEEIKNTHD